MLLLSWFKRDRRREEEIIFIIVGRGSSVSWMCDRQTNKHTNQDDTNGPPPKTPSFSSPSPSCRRSPPPCSSPSPFRCQSGGRRVRGRARKRVPATPGQPGPVSHQRDHHQPGVLRLHRRQLQRRRGRHVGPRGPGLVRQLRRVRPEVEHREADQVKKSENLWLKWIYYQLKTKETGPSSSSTDTPETHATWNVCFFVCVKSHFMNKVWKKISKLK